ncbi:MAG: hypothetical protein P8X89_24770 [Reinekea sp.]
MNPDAFEEAKALLEEAEKALAKGGKPLKYSDKELAVMLENPAIKDKYIVRFMQADYLHAKASDGTLIEFGGQLGQVDPTTGTVKYWSTTFDQIVQNDHDADLITIVPTYENLGDFAIARAKGSPESIALIRKVMTEQYSKRYAKLRELADKSVGKTKDGWDIPAYHLDDQDQLNDFLRTYFANDPEGKVLFKQRLKIESSYGAYAQYTGNGLTMSLHTGNGALSEPNKFGVKETFTFEIKPMTIQEMRSKGILDYVVLKTNTTHTGGQK